MNNNDQDIELIKQINTLSDVNQTAEKIIEEQHSPQTLEKRKNGESSTEQQLIIEKTDQMERSVQHKSRSLEDFNRTRSSETSEVLLTTAVSLNV